jgi:hypothetical protein
LLDPVLRDAVWNSDPKLAAFGLEENRFRQPVLVCLCTDPARNPKLYLFPNVHAVVTIRSFYTTFPQPVEIVKSSLRFLNGNGRSESREPAFKELPFRMTEKEV